MTQSVYDEEGGSHVPVSRQVKAADDPVYPTSHSAWQVSLKKSPEQLNILPGTVNGGPQPTITHPSNEDVDKLQLPPARHSIEVALGTPEKPGPQEMTHVLLKVLSSQSKDNPYCSGEPQSSITQPEKADGSTLHFSLGMQEMDGESGIPLYPLAQDTPHVSPYIVPVQFDSYPGGDSGCPQSSTTQPSIDAGGGLQLPSTEHIEELKLGEP